ncbi:MAG: serine protease [Iphinoe sp. HA4291-MV1]|jgi:hypothetical protein|nr:serine protease [Iphinoe sp. HA4291-MV1]
MNKTIVLIASLLFLPFPTFAVATSNIAVSQAVSNTSSCEIKAENGESGEYSEKQLQTLANHITVRVIGDNNGGSGTLLAKQGNTYLVLTNSHVVRGVNSISLKTSDGKSYPAQILTNTNFSRPKTFVSQRKNEGLGRCFGHRVERSLTLAGELIYNPIAQNADDTGILADCIQSARMPQW